MLGKIAVHAVCSLIALLGFTLIMTVYLYIAFYWIE